MIANMTRFLPLLLLSTAGFAAAHPTWERRASDPQSSLTLDPSQVQTGLEQDGSNGVGSTAGQSKSQTSSNNFINFCLTQKDVPLMNGKQVLGGACNPTIVGRVVGKKQMPSLKFVFPPNGDKSLKANQNFTIQAKIKNLQAGTFVNPNTNYLAGPQEVNAQGIVIGHTHFVIEAIPALDSTEPTDPTVFAFFKGVDTPQDNNGILSVDVTKGLPDGFYRLTSMTAAANHQPVLVTAAQRGALDDSVYFTVGKGASGDAAANKIDDAGAAAAAAVQASLTGTQPASTAKATTTAKAAATASGKANGGKSGKGGKGNNGGNGGKGGKGNNGGNGGNGGKNGKGGNN